MPSSPWAPWPCCSCSSERSSTGAARDIARDAQAPAGAIQGEITMSGDPFLLRRADRREFLTVGMGLFVALSMPVALRRRSRIVRRTVPLMGTIAEVQVAHADERFAESAID